MRRHRLKTKKLRMFKVLTTENYIVNVKAESRNDARKIVKESGVGVV
jgi:hypothetical protein